MLSSILPATTKPGKYNLTVRTDYTNTIFENSSDTNNHKYMEVTVLHRPPDLKVINIATSIKHNNIEATLSVTYTVQNYGSGSTVGYRWYDSVYLSRTSDLQSFTYLQRLASSPQYTTFGYGETYTRTKDDLTVPNNYYGQMFIIIITDSENNIEEVNERNNILTSKPVLVPQISPQTEILSLNVSGLESDVIYTGQNVIVSWSVRNMGQGTLFASNDIFFSIYVSRQNTINLSAVLVGNKIIGQTINPNCTHKYETEISLPQDLAGNYFLLMLLPQESNPHSEDDRSLYKSTAFRITSQPAPNLSPQIVSFVVSEVQDFIYITWKVTNIGNSMTTSNTWCDSMIISPFKGAISGPNTFNIGEECITTTLQYLRSYTREKHFLIDAIPPGRYILHLVTDSRQELGESKEHHNNVAHVENVVILSTLDMPNLLMDGIVLDHTQRIIPDSEVTLTYSVTNKGPHSVRIQSWIDAVYIHSEQLSTSSEIVYKGFFIKQVSTMSHRIYYIACLLQRSY